MYSAGGREEGAGGAGHSDRPARREQWASALRQASMPIGVEQDERCVACRGCACRRQESLRRMWAESDERGNARRRAHALGRGRRGEGRCVWGGGLGGGERGEERERARLGGRGRRLQKVPVRKDLEQKDLMMGLT